MRKPNAERASACGAVLLLASSLAVTGPAPLAADTLSWTSLGPFGATVLALAVDPTNAAVVYATTTSGGGVFKSTDGATWVGAHAGLPLPNLGVAALVIDPRHPSTLYAGFTTGSIGGVYKSVDGGASWSPTGPGLIGDLYPLALAIDPLQPQTIYVASNSGVDKSIDGGASWAPAKSGLPLGAVFGSLAIDPSSPQTLYVGSNSGYGDNSVGVFKTTDGGVSWRPAGAAPPPTVGILAIDPGSSQTVYAEGYLVNANQSAIYKSTDGGSSWTRLGSSHLYTDVINSLVIDPGGQHTLYAATGQGRVFKSTDGGESWGLAAQGPFQRLRALAIDPAGSGVLYAGEDAPALDGVFKSRDGGASWSKLSQGLTAVSLDAFAVSPESAGTLYASTGTGDLLATHDGGVTWTSYALPPLQDTRVVQIAVDPSAPTTLYLVRVVNSLGGLTLFALFRSRDGGASWTLLAPGGVVPLSVAIDPKDDRILYAVPPLVRSADGGDTWVVVSTSAPPLSLRQVVIDPASPANVYAFEFSSPSLFKSIDRGLTWGLVGATIGNIDALRVDAGNSATLYAAAGGDVEKSTDGGATWTVVYTPADPVNHGVSAIAVAPTVPATIYGVVAGSSLVRSADGGVTWSALATEALSGLVTGIEIDPQNARRLIAKVDGVGLQALLVPPPPCVPGAAALCLNGRRFQVEARWQTAQASGAAQALALTPDTGAFWFFSASNLELVVKVLNGCALNGGYWVFAGGLTNVGVTLNVTDTQAGVTRTYTYPPGTPFPPLQDTAAFATCP